MYGRDLNAVVPSSNRRRQMTSSAQDGNVRIRDILASFQDSGRKRRRVYLFIFYFFCTSLRKVYVVYGAMIKWDVKLWNDFCHHFPSAERKTVSKHFILLLNSLSVSGSSRPPQCESERIHFMCFSIFQFGQTSLHHL